MSSLSVKHIIDMNDLTLDDINLLLDLGKTFAGVNERPIKKLPTLRGKTIANLFLEPSTRTRTSFEIAAKRLSADGVNLSGSTSATVKGESLVDTAKTLNAMNCDAVVIRAAFAGSAQILADNMDASIVNGGDGKHQHPTQALLDLYTIKENFGAFEGLKVLIVGDVEHSRVVRSLAPTLVRLGASVTLVAPPTLLPLDGSVLRSETTFDFDAALATKPDVVYMLRVQQERLIGAPFPTLREYSRIYGMNKRRASGLKKGAIIMHPGPINRGVEISDNLEDNERSVILAQVNAGVNIRMAVFYALLGGDNSGFDA
jgi:aspartate carbamoyltransferase catalytic subunit